MTLMMPIETPSFIRGTNSMLRKPCSRADFPDRRVRYHFGVGDRDGLAMLRQRQRRTCSTERGKSALRAASAAGLVGVKAAR